MWRECLLVCCSVWIVSECSCLCLSLSLSLCVLSVPMHTCSCVFGCLCMRLIQFMNVSVSLNRQSLPSLALFVYVCFCVSFVCVCVCVCQDPVASTSSPSTHSVVFRQKMSLFLSVVLIGFHTSSPPSSPLPLTGDVNDVLKCFVAHAIHSYTRNFTIVRDVCDWQAGLSYVRERVLGVFQ